MTKYYDYDLRGVFFLCFEETKSGKKFKSHFCAKYLIIIVTASHSHFLVMRTIFNAPFLVVKTHSCFLKGVCIIPWHAKIVLTSEKLEWERALIHKIDNKKLYWWPKQFRKKCPETFHWIWLLIHFCFQWFIHYVHIFCKSHNFFRLSCS